MQSFGKGPRVARLDGRPCAADLQRYADDRRARRNANWTPTALSPVAAPHNAQCRAWWSAGTGVSPGTDGVPVDSWMDYSGFYLVQGTASAKPVFQSSGGPNTLPAVSFDGVDDYLEIGAAWAQFRTPLTVMVVCSTMQSTASFQIWSAMNTDSIFDYQGKACHESSYNNWCVRNHQTAFGTSWGLKTLYFGWDWWDTQVWNGGVASNVGWTKGGNPARFQEYAPRYVSMGYRSDYSNFFTGQISELVVFTGQLSERTRRCVELYFQTKYNNYQLT